MNFDELSPAERLIAEQAVLHLRSLNKACDMAADGMVLAIAEMTALKQGRELTRKTQQAFLDAPVDEVKKSSPARTCSCGIKKVHHGRKPRQQTTSAGDVRLSRIPLRRVRSGEGSYPADERLGVEGRYSKGAERLACLAAASWSYEFSSDRLDKLCGIRSKGPCWNPLIRTAKWLTNVESCVGGPPSLLSKGDSRSACVLRRRS